MSKPLSEHQTRTNILDWARHLKCEKEVLQIFAKYDNLLRNCTNPIERQAIGIAGNQEIMFLLSSRPGSIMAGGKIIGKE